MSLEKQLIHWMFDDLNTVIIIIESTRYVHLDIESTRISLYNLVV